MTDRSRARLALLLLIVGIMAVGAIAITLRPTITKDTWANKDDEAMTILKNCNIPGTQVSIIRLTGDYLDAAKASGSFIEFEGWYAFQVSGPLYEAGVGYKANGVRQTAKWDVDLSLRKIKPRNQIAFIFCGNNDLLIY